MPINHRRLTQIALILTLGFSLQSGLAKNNLFAPTYPSNSLIVIPSYSTNQYDRSVQQILSNVSSNNMGQRMAQISDDFLGKPYVLNPLGEGPNATIDKGPLYRTDAFDCFSFVSTVLAMAKAQNLSQFQQNILEIRYSNSTPTFNTRNHFIC